ncbi:helix-turn-helix transcriptional regulator [Asticcacaulis solisilvae]|uniref:helix-turn-helix transcriptional regulator n=1 Tax=Asticcacaulis solisilvae TaxID=1217274 RepID=UPI003FD89F11
MPITELSQLGDFVRAVRQRLRPEDFGLPKGTRRRTQGLRREEAALLCGISPTWFTWIEQGRTTGISNPSLEAMARGLRLSRAERGYLFTLAGRAEPPGASVEESDPHDVEPLLAAIAAPAYVLDRHWDAVVWNEAATELFSGWLGGEGDRNLLRYVFTGEDARNFIADWPERSRRLVAEFRADTAAFRDDPVLHDMVEDLSRSSAAFASAWKAQEVLAREGGERRFIHPKSGPLSFTQYTLRLTAFPDLKLISLVPDQSSADGSLGK